MIWRIVLEVVFLVVILFAGGPFWHCLKAPKHLRSVLADPEELTRLIGHYKYENLVAESNKVPAPPFGTYGDAIIIWDAVHYKSLASTRNLLLFIVLVTLFASWWLGAWCLAASLATFLLLGLGELPVAAKNNNANHLPSVILNLIQWRQHDEAACEEFCRRRHLEYRNLYDLLVSLNASQ
jgi:hypothetical protein